jgi:hypothetical protein
MRRWITLGMPSMGNMNADNWNHLRFDTLAGPTPQDRIAGPRKERVSVHQVTL